MESGNLDKPRAPTPVGEGDLPLVLRTPDTATRPRQWRRIALGLATIVVLLGGLGLWSLRPLPPDPVTSPATSATAPVGIAALGRLEPMGGVVILMPPAPSRDAVVRDLLIRQGSVVRIGDVLAVMETRAGAEAALGEAAAQVVLREAEVARARRMLEASKAETEAQIAVAQARLTGAQNALARADQLAGGGAITPARLEELQTDRAARAAELAQAKAGRVQLAGDVDDHPDVVSAVAAREAARAALRRAETDVENTLVTAPANGRIISVAVQVGEPSPSDGLMRLAVDGPSQAILEVHQDRIHLVQKGARVALRAAAFEGELTGQVDLIGIEVQRQAVFDADPAANSDARVFEVWVTLDAASSAIARDLINLQVLADIKTGAAP